MEKSSVVNHLFDILDKSATIIETDMQESDLESVALSAENIYDDDIKQSSLKQQLQPLYDRFFVEGMTAEDVRRAFQLAVLKRMKKSTQPHHQMTPDAVALFMGYLVNKLFPKEPFRLLDQATGTGNLLTAVVNQTENRARAYGVEVDELLVQLTQANANLQQHTIELFHQDALRPLLLDPVDVTVTDLPVGYYPDGEYARTFELGKNPGAVFSPYLMIEQALKYTKPGGYGVFLIPNALFEWDEDKKLHNLLTSEAMILGVLQLPITMFKDEQHGKSILIIRKQGPNAHAPEQTLLAKLPSFKEQESLLNITRQIDKWFHNYLK